jgi:hypothetical protein
MIFRTWLIFSALSMTTFRACRKYLCIFI